MLRRLFDGDLRWIGQPLLVFLFTRAFVSVATYVGAAALPAYYDQITGSPLLDAWVRWDSGMYLSIANEGYQFRLGEVTNIVFFPLYPLLISALGKLVGDPVVAGIVISHLSLLGALVFLYRLTLLEFGDDATAQRAVTYLAVFPLAYYLGAVYTESIFLLLTVAGVYFARRREWAWAGLMGLLASATRPVGVLLWGVLLLEWLREHGMALGAVRVRDVAGRLATAVRTDWSSLLFVWVAPVGLLSFMVFSYVNFRDPVAFWTVQGMYGRVSSGPLQMIAREIGILVQYRQELLTDSAFWIGAVHLTAALFALVMAIPVSLRLGDSYGFYVVASVLIPLSSATVSLSRFVMVLFPIFMVLGHWGRNTTLDKIISVGFSVLLGAFSVFIVNWAKLY